MFEYELIKEDKDTDDIYTLVAMATDKAGNCAEVTAKLVEGDKMYAGCKFRLEVTSTSNCTDYQARKTKTRIGKAGAGDAQILHTLNSTAIATERTICCILENYQQADGSVRIPEVLVPYMGGKTIIEAQK